MAERSLRIEAFRNIGFKEGKPWRERLVLNNSLKKGELGDLLILIGANNSGKSNILNALNIFGNGQISDRDTTDLYTEDECKTPSITLFARDNGDKEDAYSYKKILNEKDTVNYPNVNQDSYKFQFSSTENIGKDLQSLADLADNTLGRSSEWRKLLEICSNDEFLDQDKFTQIMHNSFSLIEKAIRASSRSWEYSSFVSQITKKTIYKEYEGYQKYLEKPTPEEILKQSYEGKYGYDFIPQIFEFSEREIINKDLEISYSSIEESAFFKAVFKSINVNIDEIRKAYDEYSRKHNMGVLQSESKKLNKKLESISEKFNKLYCLEKIKYQFEINLQESKLYFVLYRGENTILLDYQSAGFKWFFNIFFNLLNANNINPGDVIIMDEPATHLHRDGRKELRALFKEFAIQNDITIVIATHEDALIDLDHLDELRIVINENNISRIVNTFAAVDSGITDVLLPIRKALTVENHILVNPDETVIFVEGITDYNYLTAFKKLLGKKGITFLPINGIEKDCKKVSEELIRIRKHDPILLVDNDEAGRLMKKVNEKDSALKVRVLSEANEDFKTIESLFAQEDLQKFNLLDENGKFVKHASTSTVFKNQVQKNSNSISKATKDNFEKLFKYLEDEIN
ncbi:AAA family ATPase [uncultured Fibrobacter sp.]|uniref:AAA family ATPase n=1 Tax=uncultured Fibrobacter sp. TaxID=261512 RepID=UPI0025F960BC|nr:AAA family ATPase [uncultured Fibrobacter sp.]